MDLPCPLPDSVSLHFSPSGFPFLEVRTPLAEARVFFHGAHVTHFQPAGEAPLLFLSEESLFRAGKPIRGGIPLIFPWFGPREGDESAPAHGLVRTREWAFSSVKESAEGIVEIEFELAPDVSAIESGNGGWLLTYRVIVGTSLRLELAVKNTSTEDFAFEEAFHTYFQISDVRGVEVLGLEQTEYTTKIEDLPRKREGEAPIRITQETDRVYLSSDRPTAIIDPGLKRRILIEKEGGASVVVWNPWIAKAERLADFGNDEWPQMLCIETGNIGENRWVLAPDEAHTFTTTLSIEAL